MSNEGYLFSIISRPEIQKNVVKNIKIKVDYLYSKKCLELFLQLADSN